MLNADLKSLFRGGEQIPIPPKPLATLEFLIENRHRVVSKTELLDAVWHGRQEINTVEQAVRKIRTVLEDDADHPSYIQTISGQGYRFIAEIRPPEVSSPGEARSPRLSRRALLTAAGIGLPIAGAAGFAAYRFLHSEPVARAAVNGTNLLAFGATGHLLWHYPFAEPLLEPRPDEPWHLQIVDINGDGLPEILFAAIFASEPDHPHQLFCFSSGGKMLWSYSPKADFRFNRPDLDGPWHLTDLVVVRGGSSTQLWASVAHDEWWPGFVVRISGAGAASIVYVSSGVVFKLQHMQTRAGAFILAAGVNNEYRQAALALLQENGTLSATPQTAGSEFQCITGCGNAGPYRYFLLPRSEINEAAGRPYNEAHDIRLRPDGFTVRVSETEGSGPAPAYYEFSRDLLPQRVVYSSAHRVLHEKFERDGRIHHRYEDCPERHAGAELQIWEQAGGWRKQTIPRILPYQPA